MEEFDLDNIRNLYNKARPGPWVSHIEGRDHTSGCNFIMIGHGSSRMTDIELSEATVADQDFIAASRQLIPELLDEIERLRSLLPGRK